ncbi:Chromate transport protein [Granulibacter bethesdensis CGDNIH1]|uniref:Chromate transport protein n=2 Tax=Granulibacter bethesdensis TaxID=364410 RepID=Q0BU73_GRABC|nr:Chromate transport protein [Granulibacter bethesdensis CGDNIH1]APH51434.1 Chromate transport protein [Granulibacter bethesdensis]APH64127.1 Chromate transport protein [Granulibacter bethesdensis]
MMSPRLLDIIMLFGGASLLSFGGGNAIVPHLQMQTVEVYHWLTAEQFADAYAMAQVAPGPSTLLVTILGYDAAGIPGAVLATIAMLIPSSLLVFGAALLWKSMGEGRFRRIFERAMAPLAVGLVLASGIIITKSNDHSWPAYGITAASTLVLCRWHLHPVAVMACCGVIGWLVKL